jgi:3-dehydroquinate synthase
MIATTDALSIPVDLGRRGYEVVVGAGLLETAGARIAALGARRVMVVTDSIVDGLHGGRLRAGLGALARDAPLVLPPGEGQKSWEGLRTVCEALIAARLERRDMVVAFGGGVVGDLAGFAAAITLRGLDFIQIPTALLAQVDSSVGGKTAIDTALGKNLVGAFHQPRLVLADTTTLATLPPRERACGLAETVKYGLIDDPALADWCADNAPALRAGEARVLEQAVAFAVRAKARVVAADEREAGARALLNLGHTFGHGLEALAGMDGALLHGEAVGCGMAMAFRLSARLGLCPPDDARRAAGILAALGLETDPRRLPGAPFDPRDLLAALHQDKKNTAGTVTLILLRGIGQAFVQQGVDDGLLLDFLMTETG